MRSASAKLGGAYASARTQSLLSGEGTPIDLTFGIGKDGEAPMSITGKAYSVQNGALDPHAPTILPYASISGSGTDSRVATVGYFNQPN